MGVNFVERCFLTQIEDRETSGARDGSGASDVAIAVVGISVVALMGVVIGLGVSFLLGFF